MLGGGEREEEEESEGTRQQKWPINGRTYFKSKCQRVADCNIIQMNKSKPANPSVSFSTRTRITASGCLCRICAGIHLVANRMRILVYGLLLINFRFIRWENHLTLCVFSFYLNSTYVERPGEGRKIPISWLRMAMLELAQMKQTTLGLFILLILHFIRIPSYSLVSPLQQIA